MGRRLDLSRTLPLLIALVAMVVLWLMPDIRTDSVDAGAQPQEAWRAVVVEPAPPDDPDDPLADPNRLIVELVDGPRAGEQLPAFLGLPSTQTNPVDFSIGDEVVAVITEDFDGSEFVLISERYRLPVLGLLVLLFSLTMVLVGGWQGVRALVALGLTILLVVKLLIPLILEGAPPVPLAIALASLVTVAAVLLTEGLTRVSAVAITGTIGGLAITAVLAWLVQGPVGYSVASIGELGFLYFPSGEGVDVDGLLLAAIILGAVGVLDDVTVTQAATVEELAARTHEGARQLWRQAFRVGRSHIAATTNTLFMAYVGASLPVIAYIVVVAEPTLLTLNRELLALEIVRTLVGSIGIVLAMPLTTLLAVLVFGRRGEAAPA